MANRDEFSLETKKVLCDRVGGLCSNPGCRTRTVGPHSDPSKRLSIGVAAHITAAAEGGPRYNPSLTKNQRKNAQNGIWLCETCARLIDKDETLFPVDLLIDWKIKAEKDQLSKMLQDEHDGNKVDISINTLNISTSNSQAENPKIESWRTLAQCLEEYQEVLEDTNRIREQNFGRCFDRRDLQNSIDRYGDNLYSSMLERINCEFYRARQNLQKAMSVLFIDMSVSLKDMLEEYINMMKFKYSADDIGIVNNYWSEFFFTLSENYERILKIKREIDVLIRTEYRMSTEAETRSH